MAKCKVCGYRLGEGVTKCPMCGATAGSTIAGEISPELNLPKYFCPSCNSQILGEHRYCPSCGIDLKEAAKKAENLKTQKQEITEEKKCVNCGAVLTPNAKFCPECGAKQEVIPVEQASKEPAISKKLKTESKNKQKQGPLTTSGGLVNGQPETPMEAFEYEIEDGKYVLTGLKKKYKNQSKIVIPGIFYRIDSCAFYDKDIRSVVIKNGVKEIGSRAFSFCKRLDTICLPDTLEKIEESAFSYCYDYDNYRMIGIYNLFPSSIKFYGEKLFNETDKVKLLTIGRDEDDDEEFLDIENIDTLELPDTLETISDNAFFPIEGSSCNLICCIKTLIIPESVKKIGINAFRGFYIERVIIKNKSFNKEDVRLFLGGGYLPKELIIGGQHIEYSLSDKIFFRALGTRV